MKRPIVFSLVREQSIFMTVVMGLMTFMAVLAMGVAIAISSGVVKWNRQWDVHATVQVASVDKLPSVKKILKENEAKIDTVHEVSADEMTRLMQPWVGGGKDTLKRYLPTMYEIKFKSKDDMNTFGDAVEKHARFIVHREALRPSISAGWKTVAILAVVLVLVLGTIGACVSFIARNTAVLHKRELEILNQVGASDSFVAHQMQIIVAKICLVACSIGFVAALPVLASIIAVARSVRVGLISMLNIDGTGWGILIALPIIIIIFAILITKRTTLKILNQEQ